MGKRLGNTLADLAGRFLDLSTRKGKMAFALLVFGCTMLAVALSTAIRPPYTRLTVKAEPFQWPQGCEPKRYTGRDDISVACKVEAYALPKDLTYAHGFDPGKKSSGRFYRVGNDAIAFACPPWGKTCIIKRVYHDVFVVTPAK